MPPLTAHQSAFIAALDLDHRDRTESRSVLERLIGERLDELAVLREVEDRWDQLAEGAKTAARGGGRSPRAFADARQAARAAMRSLSSFGMPDADRAADVAESLMRNDSERDRMLLGSAVREVISPSRSRLAARRSRLEQEVDALKVLIERITPKRLAPPTKRAAASARRGTGPAPPGPMIQAGAGGWALYREPNAAIVEELARAGAVDEEQAGAILGRFEPYTGLAPTERRQAGAAYLRFIEGRWRDLGKPAALAEVAGRLTLARVGDRGTER